MCKDALQPSHCRNREGHLWKLLREAAALRAHLNAGELGVREVRGGLSWKNSLKIRNALDVRQPQALALLQLFRFCTSFHSSCGHSTLRLSTELRQ